MSYLVFTNPGEIDPVAMLTFGVSAKEKDTAIGMFGTGLKYALAVLLRNGYGIKILSGNKEYTFTTQQSSIRNSTFNVVCMNGEPIHFTTDLGKFWEPWMAVRELASNAMDENGEWGVRNTVEHTVHTTIVISGNDIEQLARSCNDVFLKTSPLFVDSSCEVHGGISDWIYYRGIRAMKLDQPSIYTYNIVDNLTLTEDRTIKFFWDVQSIVTRTINSMTDKEMMKRCVSAGNTVMEGTLTYSIFPSDVMLEVVGKLMASFEHVPTSLKTLCNKSLLQTLMSTEVCVLDHIDQQRLDKAVAFCQRIGFHVEDYPIKVSAHLGESVLGRAADGTIYISKRTFHMGTKMLVGTLIEEYLHLSEGVSDESRAMQNLLFDTICSLGERITGEVL